jgi:hypothetical protein
MDVDLTIEYLGKSKNEYTLNDAKTGIKEWRGSDAQPTSSELTKGWSDYQAAQAAIKYKTDRAAQYPPIGDQLDALYHANLFPTEMAEKIRTVKDRNPKPS